MAPDLVRESARADRMALRDRMALEESARDGGRQDNGESRTCITAP
ncbi:hypothetical protein FAGKG844_10119 [Frankia sp. AgKG'84/4]